MGVEDLSQSCVGDYRQGAWGLMRSGGKWGRFSNNAVGKKDSLSFWFRFL